MATTIHQIDSIPITILIDNLTDFLLTNSAHAIRPQLIKKMKKSYYHTFFGSEREYV